MPKDPVMLLSFVNTQLRDNYNTLEELCKSYMVSEKEITDKLKTIVTTDIIKKIAEKYGVELKELIEAYRTAQLKELL